MRVLPQHPNTTPSGPSSASKAVGCVCGGLAAPKACSRGARRQEKGIEGGGDQSHRSLSPSANRLAQLAGPTHPPQTRRPHSHCPPARRDVPRAVAAPSPALLVSKSTAVDSVATWVLRLSRDGHIGFLPDTGGSVRRRAERIRRRAETGETNRELAIATNCQHATQSRGRTKLGATTTALAGWGLLAANV